MLEDYLDEIASISSFLHQNPLPEALEQNLEEDFKLHYTYDSNAIEGNTLTLMETKVVLEGITIGGKSLKEHFEIINHAEAIDYIKEIVRHKEPLSEFQIKSIHHLILKNIDDKNAGAYRKVNVKIAGARHIPPSYIEVQDEMERFIQWYKNESEALHPVIRASRVHIDFVGIHPFVDGNGRTSRLLMNLELLKAHLPAINIKNDKKLEYYVALDEAHRNKDYSKFDNLVASYVLERLKEKERMVLENEERFRMR
ncbi:cell filamentation protein Fic [Helicobacter pullorum]|uniref:Fic family protein n=1 Tax=Helicobacter pullorum TaxID=35818 RepID=UPI000816980B|nr:Fic family protein [Helicobacter pullorum]OCR18420.1 cell filamentation protein Fic [Helicobacter pullorum]